MVDIAFDSETMEAVLEAFGYMLAFGFFFGTALHLLSYGIFKAFRLINIRL